MPNPVPILPRYEQPTQTERRAGNSSSTARTTRSRGAGGRFTTTAPPVRVCAKCNTTKTSQWRTGSDGGSLCNKCGIKVYRRAAAAAQLKQAQTTATATPTARVPLPPIGTLINNADGHLGTPTTQLHPTGRLPGIHQLTGSSSKYHQNTGRHYPSN